jgi:hypothetical protein
MHLRNKNREHVRAKINYAETNCKNKNIRELYTRLNDFKKGYQPRTNVVKDEKVDLIADSHSILATRKIYFSPLLTAYGDNDDRQTETPAEPLVPEPNASEVKGNFKAKKD